MTNLTLVSHVLCPYVQRAAIALTEKGITYTRTDIDLSDRPEWFSELSPLGKVPLLVVATDAGRSVIFESAVILEYLEETQPNPLHPADALLRARHRSWIEFGSAQLASISRLYTVRDEAAFEAECAALSAAFARIETELTKRQSAGQWFDGERVSLVDAVYGPVFRYFDLFETGADLHLLDGLPRVAEWRSALRHRPSIRDAVLPDYPVLLERFIRRKAGRLASRLAPAA